MTFEQLEYFIAACQCKTFFDAAEQLHTTQSTLSKQIKKLETELSVTLFDRSRRSASLTPAGEAFYPEAMHLLNQYTAMRQKMHAYCHASACVLSLSIGTLPFLSQYALMPLLNGFKQAHPEISVRITEAEEEELMNGFLQKRFDLVLLRETMIDPDEDGFFPLARDTLSVMLPESHKLAACKHLSLSQIGKEPFLLMPPYTSIYQLCRKLFSDAGITPSVIRTSRVESLIGAVSLGEGISLFAESNFKLFQHPGVVAVPLLEAPKLSVGAAYKKTGADSAAPAVTCFLSYCENKDRNL